MADIHEIERGEKERKITRLCAKAHLQNLNRWVTMLCAKAPPLDFRFVIAARPGATAVIKWNQSGTPDDS
jgi:hypothetical protein